MSKEKTLDELLNEYASKGTSKSEPAKKTSFLGAAKNSIQVHREVNAAVRKAEQERLTKERAEAEKARKEREKAWADSSTKTERDSITFSKLPDSTKLYPNMRQKFVSCEVNEKYAKIKNSALNPEIIKHINNIIPEKVKKTYVNEYEHNEHTFRIESQGIDFIYRPSLKFLDFGFGKMSEDAVYAIAFLVYEQAYKCCKETGLCKETSCEFEIDSDYPLVILVRIRIKPKPNTELKKF